MQAEVTYEDWHAYRDHMGKKLRVTGSCKTHGGMAVSLEDHEGEPRFNPQALVLDLVFVVTGESPSTVPVQWEADWDPEGPQFTEVEFAVRGSEVEPPPPLKFEDIE